MSLSIGRLGGMSGVSYVSSSSENNALSNQSQVSDVYQESAPQSVGAAVGAANPVQYPTVQVQENQVSQLQSAQRADRAYQAVGSAFEGMTTSYGPDLAGMTYNRAGANIDVYA